jgi:Ca2+-binding EF-hand superfamily protein
MSSGEFAERSKALVAAFAVFDTKKTGKVPTPLVTKLLTTMAVQMTADELAEFVLEADDGGVIRYEDFVNNVIFGTVK